jgi:hypothetical protein
MVNHKLLQQGYRYVTTNFVLDETYTLLLRKGGHHIAVRFGDRIGQTQLVEIIHISPSIEEDAWLVFKKYDDKLFSFTDCISFVVMRQHDIHKTFTSDHHFRQMGFETLLEL